MATGAELLAEIKALGVRNEAARAELTKTIAQHTTEIAEIRATRANSSMGLGDHVVEAAYTRAPSAVPNGRKGRIDVRVAGREQPHVYAADGESVVLLRGDGRGLLDSRPKSDWQQGMQRAYADEALRRVVAPDDIESAARCRAQLEAHARTAPPLMRAALLSDIAGQGQEMAPTTMVQQIDTPMVIPSVILGLFDFVEAPVVNGRFVNTQWKNFAPGRRGGPSSVDNPSPGTYGGLKTSDAEMTPAYYEVAAQIDMDWLSGALPATEAGIDAMLGASMALNRSHTAINGSTGLNLDTGYATWDPNGIFGLAAGATWGTPHVLSAEDGFRARAFGASASSDLGSAQTYAGIKAFIKSQLSSYAKSGLGIAGALVLVVSVDVAFLISDFDEFRTVDKAGISATALVGLGGFANGAGIALPPGLVGFFDGVPVFVEAMMTDDLASTGKYTGTGNAKGSVLAIDRRDYEVVTVRGYSLGRQYDIRTNQTHAVARQQSRIRKRSVAANVSCAIGFNLG